MNHKDEGGRVKKCCNLKRFVMDVILHPMGLETIPIHLTATSFKDTAVCRELKMDVMHTLD